MLHCENLRILPEGVGLYTQSPAKNVYDPMKLSAS